VLGFTALQYLRHISSIVGAVIWERNGIPASEAGQESETHQDYSQSLRIDYMVGSFLSKNRQSKAGIRIPPFHVVAFPVSY
jgi:hypothetical protein